VGQGAGIDVDEIGGFVGKLTPVLLRNDTLVKNHDYKKGKAVAFDALLEAGIAVLVDLYGKPVMQCSCGNPLGAFEHDVDKADVEFKGTNKKWTSYDHDKVVKVEPTDDGNEVEAYRLLDVQEPDAGLERPVGSDGAQDTSLPEDPGKADAEDNGGYVEVPDVTQSSVEEASRILEDQGLAVETTQKPSETAGPGTVLGQSPAAGEKVPASSTVTLMVATAPVTTDPQATAPQVTPTPGELATPTPTDVATPGDTPPVPEPPPSDGLFGSTS
jgi:PASTA domain